MEILKKIEIKNYRGLRYIEFTPRSINVIVGPNNTGKSSILEAISLAISAKSKFEDSVGFNFFEYLFELKKYNPKYITHINENKAEIQIVLENKKKYTVTIEHYPKGLPDDGRYGLVVEYLEKYAKRITDRELGREYQLLKEASEYFLESIKNYIDETKIEELKRDFLRKYLPREIRRYAEDEYQKLIEQLTDELSTYVMSSSKIMITIYNPNNEIAGLYLYIPERTRTRIYTRTLRHYLPPIYLGGIYTIVRPKLDTPSFNVVLNFQKSAVASNVGNLYDLAVSKGKIKNAIEILKERIPYVEDIRKIEQGMYVLVSHHNVPIPLSSMGDGFVTLLKLSFLIALAENGILILEEPEVSLHPYFMDIVAEEIVTNSKNVQFFISTHSLDMLTSLLEKAEEEDKLDDVNIICLHYREDTKKVYAEVLSGTDAKNEIDEIGTDLRYT